MRACGTEQALEIKAGNNVFVLSVTIITLYFGMKHIISRGQDNGSHFNNPLLRLLVQVDRVIFTDTDTNRAFLIFQKMATFINIRNKRDCLGKKDMDRFIC